MLLYKIKDWDTNFENSKTRQLKKLNWLPISNNLAGDGYIELIEKKDGPALFGTWIAVCEAASKCKIRGTLVRDNGEPHNPKTLARITRIQEKLIVNMLDVCQKDPIWIEAAPYRQDPSLDRQIPSLDRQETVTEGRKEGKKEGKKPDYKITSIQYQLSYLLFKKLSKDGSGLTKPDLQKWASEIDLMIRVDKRSGDWIRFTLANAMEDDFWKEQIRSTKNFRKKVNEGRLDDFIPSPSEKLLTDEELEKVLNNYIAKEEEVSTIADGVGTSEGPAAAPPPEISENA